MDVADDFHFDVGKKSDCQRGALFGSESNDLFHTVGSSSNNPDGGGIDFVRTGAAEFVLALINVCLAVNENEVSMNPFSTVCALTLNLIVLIVFSF